MLMGGQKWLRRMNLLEHKIATDKGEHLRIWKWLRQVIQGLGHDGMSSEESDVEDDMDTILRVKTLPWRRNLEKELTLIDSLRVQDPGNYSRCGSKPALGAFLGSGSK